MKIIPIYYAVLMLSALNGLCAESGAPAENPKPVNVATEMLLKPVKLRLATRMGEAVIFLSESLGLPMSVAEEDSTIEVTFVADRVTLGEALRKLKDATKLDYRIANGAVQFASAERFAAIEAGKAKYVPSTAADKGYGYKYIWTDDRGFNIVDGDMSSFSDERLAKVGVSKPITASDISAVFDNSPMGKGGAKDTEASMDEANIAMRLLEDYAFYPETQSVGEVLGRIMRKEARSRADFNLVCSKSVGERPLKLGRDGHRLIDILKQIKAETGCAIECETKDTKEPQKHCVFIRLGSKDELAGFRRDPAAFVAWDGPLPEVQQPPEDKAAKSEEGK